MQRKSFYINIDAILEASEYLGTSASRIGAKAASEMDELARAVLIDVLLSAFQVADSDDGFPGQFQNHLLSVAERIPITCFFDGREIFVEIDFDDFGNEEDLQKAFHQGARLADNTVLWGPYTGQALKNEDAGTRHQFWEAIRYNESSVTVNGKTVHVNRSNAPEHHTWEETIEQYISIWGDKAPEWLFIQFGQEEWAPYIPAYDIIDAFETAIWAIDLNYLVDSLQREVDIANLYRSAGLDVGFTVRGQPRLTSGTYVNPRTGKTIKPGQFAPKL